MSFISKWKDKITEYFDVRIQLAKLSFIERTSKILGHLVFLFLVLSLMLPILIFVGIGLAEVFTAAFDSRIGGFFMTVGVYVLVMLILVALRKNIIRKFAGIFIKALTDDGDEENDKDKEVKP